MIYGFGVYKIMIKICGRFSEALRIDTEAQFCYLSGSDGAYPGNPWIKSPITWLLLVSPARIPWMIMRL